MKTMPRMTKMSLRDRVVTVKQKSKNRADPSKWLFGEANYNPIFTQRPWLLKVPKDIRQQAAFELHKNWKAAKGKGVSYKEKDPQWTISVENDHVHILHGNKIDLYSRKMKLTVRAVGKLPAWLTPLEGVDCLPPPCQVQIQKRGQSYYMLFPHQVNVAARPMKYEGHIVSIDPGVRKFATTYGTDGRVAFMGMSRTTGRSRKTGPVARFARIAWYKDYLNTQINAPRSSTARISGVQRQRAKKKLRRIQIRVENIRRDFHHKVANWLTKNYTAVIIGKLPKGIISRDRSLPKVVKRAYNNLGHYKFRCCLKEKCQQRGVVYQEINEAYTSKTCTCCGRLNDVGSSETYTCTCRPGQAWDRDVQGARNILLKSLSESYLRIVSSSDSKPRGKRSNKTLSVVGPVWTQHPAGFSLALDILAG